MKIEHGIDPKLREQAAQIYWAAFCDKLGSVLGPDEKGIALFLRVLDGKRAIIAREEGELLGIAGYDLGEGGLFGGGFLDIYKTYGLSAIWRSILLMAFTRIPKQDSLLIDGIAVAQNARGKGVGTALLQALYQKARDENRKSVTLEVINTNPRARALYIRQGFEVNRVSKMGWLSRFFNFESAEQMIKKI